MNVEPDAVFLSLRPRFARAILDGRKSAEVRRRCPRAEPGAIALLYASSPLRQVVGSCVIEDVIQASPSQLWDEHGGEMGLTRVELRTYLQGALAPTVLLLSKVQPLLRPLPLDELRRLWRGFRPPQSYRFVPDEVARMLILDAAGAPRLQGAGSS